MLNKAAEDDTDVSKLVLMQVCRQVAEGMKHLHLYNIIHRDLEEHPRLLPLRSAQLEAHTRQGH